MKLSNIPILPWSALLILFATASSNSSGLVSAAPFIAPPAEFDTPTPTVRVAIPTDTPASYSTQVDHPVDTQVVHMRQSEGDDDSLRDPATKCYVSPQGIKICNHAKPDVEPVEEDEDSEREGSVEFSKRRMQVYGAIRWVNPADIRKRDRPFTPRKSPSPSSSPWTALKKVSSYLSVV
ncbi:hypothetical protein BGZ47_008386 [Haplosporangium gracile]|nr:hypothetical protein BGZ47_008386 [Haplosporangium gracile]